MSSKIFKAFSLQPVFITDLDGVVLDISDEMRLLAREIRDMTAIVEWNIDRQLALDTRENDKSKDKITQANALGRKLGITIPEDVLNGKKSGKSRFKEMIYARTINETRSWLERIKVLDDTTEKHVSQGWLRTVSGENPGDLQPKMSLSTVNKQYCSILNDYFVDGVLDMRLVINGQWRILYFKFDHERFVGASKVTLPDVTLNQHGVPIFHFTAMYDYHFGAISEEYVTAVDIGVNSYATVSVISVKTGNIVYSTVFSLRVRSLKKTVDRAEAQVRNLQAQGRSAEAARHREANSRRKRELAILAAQEVADIAFDYGNTFVVVEELSWVKNTMQYGRRNHGEFRRWLEHYVNLNGSRMMKVSAHNTSQVCHQCKSQLRFKTWTTPECKNTECHQTTLDRDVNATANIAHRFINQKFLKAHETRKKVKRYTGKKKRRSPQPPLTLKYPGRDRTKNHATPKRPKQHKKAVKQDLKQCSVSDNDDRTTVMTGAHHETDAVSMTLEMQHEILPRSPIYHRLS